MKTLHKINLIALLITLGLYVTIFFGMMAQFFLGIIQLFFMIRLAIERHKYPDIHKHIMIYWMITIAALFAIITRVIFEFTLSQSILIGGFFVIPMLLAVYSVYITWLVYKIEINTKINQNEN
ncbi:MAG: hypothetical protein ACOVLC_14940 [Flavobacterium sp.]